MDLNLVSGNFLDDVSCYRWMNTCANVTLCTQAYWSKLFYGYMRRCTKFWDSHNTASLHAL